MVLYREDDNRSFINEDDIPQLKAEVQDLSHKIAELDNNLNRMDFVIKSPKNEVSFERFLAKDVLKAVRKILTEKVIKREKNIISLEEKFKKDED